MKKLKKKVENERIFVSNNKSFQLKEIIENERIIVTSITFRYKSEVSSPTWLPEEIDFDEISKRREFTIEKTPINISFVEDEEQKEMLLPNGRFLKIISLSAEDIKRIGHDYDIDTIQLYKDESEIDPFVLYFLEKEVVDIEFEN
jgi:hypothetical protein